MKLKHLIWGGLAAWTSFHLVNNRQTIKKEVAATKALADESLAHLRKIQDKLQFIQTQTPHLAAMTQDLNYKLRLFQDEVEARVAQIPLIQKEAEQQN